MGENKHVTRRHILIKIALVGRDVYQTSGQYASVSVLPNSCLASVAIFDNTYNHVIKERNSLYNDNDLKDNYSIININITTSISTYHLNLGVQDYISLLYRFYYYVCLFA